MNKRLNPFLLLFVLLFFLYLSLNVLLNFTPLRERVVDHLENETFRNVEISFLYLNWKFRPTVRSIKFERDPSGNRSTTFFRLSNVQLVLDWTAWYNSSLWGFENKIRRVSVNRAKVVYQLEGQLPELKPTGIPGVLNLGGQLPDLPIVIDQWDIHFRNTKRNRLTLSGTDLRYKLGPEPVTTRITRIEDKKSTIRAVVTTLDPLRIEATVDQLSLPDSIWELSGDNWVGTMDFQAGDTSTMSLSLTGVPGVIKDEPLPPVDVEATLRARHRLVSLKKFRARADYLRLSMGGTVDLRRWTIDLRGDYSLRLKKRLNTLLPDGDPASLRVSVSEPLTGDLSVSGSLDHYRVGGAFQLPVTKFNVGIDGHQQSVKLSDLKGSITADGLRLSNGVLTNGARTFRLDRGTLNLEEGVVKTDLAGLVTTMGFNEDHPVGHYLTELFGSIESAEVPIGFSARATPSFFAGDLVVKNGSVEFKRGTFGPIRLLLSYSSRPRARNVVRGEWTDPAGNDWGIQGDLRGPISFVSTLNNLEPVKRNLPLLQSSYLADFSLEGIRLEGKIGNLADISGDYRLTFQLENSRVLVGAGDPKRLPLEGRVRLEPESVTIEDVRLGSPSSRLSLDGTVSHTSGWDSGTWDLDVRGRNFNLGSFFRLGTVATTDLTMDLEVTEQLRNPTLSGAFRNSDVRVQSFFIHNLNGNLAAKDHQLAIQNVRGNLAGGQLTGGLDYNFGTRRFVDVSVTLEEFSLPELFPEGTWMYKKSHGTASLGVDLRGDPFRSQSLEGSIRGSGREVSLDNFPKFKDIREVARPAIFERRLSIQPFEFTFPVDSGVVRVSDFRLSSGEIDLKTSGTATLGGELSLDLILELRGRALKQYLQDVLGNLYRQVGLQAGAKKLTIPLKVKGTVEKPILDVQRSEVSKNFRKNLIEDLLSDPIGKPINELIDEIFLID